MLHEEEDRHNLFKFAQEKLFHFILKLSKQEAFLQFLKLDLENPVLLFLGVQGSLNSSSCILVVPHHLLQLTRQNMHTQARKCAYAHTHTNKHTNVYTCTQMDMRTCARVQSRVSVHTREHSRSRAHTMSNERDLMDAETQGLIFGNSLFLVFFSLAHERCATTYLVSPHLSLVFPTHAKQRTLSKVCSEAQSANCTSARVRTNRNLTVWHWQLRAFLCHVVVHSRDVCMVPPLPARMFTSVQSTPRSFTNQTDME